MKLAIYDFDGTYVSKQTLPLLYKLWKSKGLNLKTYRKIWRRFMWRFALYKLKVFGWDKRRMHPYTMRQTADLFKSIDRLALDQFLNDYYIFLQDYVFQDLKAQLKKDKEQGYHTVLLSGNLDIILKPFKQDGFDTIIGTLSEKNNQILAPDQIEILIEDKKKEALVAKFPHADFLASKAYADNGYDLPVLTLVGHAYAVKPDKELRDYAIKHDFEIID